MYILDLAKSAKTLLFRDVYNVLKTGQLVLLVAEDTGYKTDLVQNAIQQYKDVFYVIHQEQSAHSAMKDSTKKESHVSPAPISKIVLNVMDLLIAQNVSTLSILPLVYVLSAPLFRTV